MPNLLLNYTAVSCIIMHPKNLSIKDFTYSLPEEKIACYPMAERDASRLLIYNDGVMSEDIYKNLDKHLPDNSLLVFNDTKVVAARLMFQKPTGAAIEIFCLEPDEQYPDITIAMAQKGRVLWQCLIGGASKWKHGQILEKRIKVYEKVYGLSAKYTGKNIDTFIIELSWTPATLSFAEILQISGAVPLPPYIKREAEKTDTERYQTIFAQEDGSVAAPTAGLHFTQAIFEKLETKKIKQDFITLHVGAGTFKPVKSEKMDEHAMHAEWIDVSIETIKNILHQLNKPIIAVGTTSLRTIESLYWIGNRLYKEDADKVPEIAQWEAYEHDDNKISAEESLQYLQGWMEKNKLKRLFTRTHILIAPGYKPKIANAMITNFHMPQSTLLLLVAAVAGNDWRKIYDYALEKNFRFLSYGDGSLIWFVK